MQRKFTDDSEGNYDQVQQNCRATSPGWDKRTASYNTAA